MHVAPPDLRAIRQRGLVLRFAMLGSIAFVLAEVPEAGSAGTSIEEPTRLANWGLVIDGELTYIGNGTEVTIPAGNAFHVRADGADHHFVAPGGTRIAGFLPVDSSTDTTDPGLAEQGFEVLGPGATGSAVAPAGVESFGGLVTPAAGVIDANSWAMPPYVLTRVQFGQASGYTTDLCEAPHWGLVTAGQLVIEYERDVEILSAGDVYYCPQGLQAHRFQAADPASIVDLTPIEALTGEGRVAAWRRAALARAEPEPTAVLSVVGLG